MAIRRAVLICVYKLGGVVHEVKTSQITVTNMNSSHFDRVIFHRYSTHITEVCFYGEINQHTNHKVSACTNSRRVYQDAEVIITQNFTSEKPVGLPPTRNLPNTTTSVLNLHPDRVVFYVGGYPKDFTVTSHCYHFFMQAFI